MARARRQVPRDVTLRWIDIDGERFALFEWPIATTPTSPSAEPSVPDEPTSVPDEPAPSAARPDLTQLSPAERAVLAYVTRGDSNAQIAAARRTSVRTVANQVAKLLRKLGASSRFDLIRWYGRA